MVRRKANRDDNVLVQYQNKIAQMVGVIAPKKLYLVLGRGSSKTTDILAERVIDIIFDMPGAPCLWVSDTFANLTANVLPGILEGLERKGFHEGRHFVVEKEPPEYSAADTEDLPAWLRPHFWRPVNHLLSYKRTIIFFTGTNIRFGSLDRPSTMAGLSICHLFGDEAKYFKREKLAPTLKTLRGYRHLYGESVFWRGETFTTDMPDISHIGEDDWILEESSKMDSEKMLLIAKVGFIRMQALSEYVAAKQSYTQNPTPEGEKNYKLFLRSANRWDARWKALRSDPKANTLALRASSYINADILSEDWFNDAMRSSMGDFNQAVLSLPPEVSDGDKFYFALGERHFFDDGINENKAEQYSMREEPDCGILKYLDLTKPLEIGVDFGNMCSMTVAQPHKDIETGRVTLYILKFLYTLPPDHIPQLAKKFRTFFAPMSCPIVRMFYDRAGNANRAVGNDSATALKKAIEFDETGKRTKFTVILESLQQGNIGQNEEYLFMAETLSGANKRLPIVKIDRYQCKYLKKSLVGARTTKVNGVIKKDKRSEKLPFDQLPERSTNASDSFKYLLMRQQWRDIVKNLSNSSIPIIPK